MTTERLYKVRIAYEGTPFAGFQTQARERLLHTVQDLLEERLSKLFAQPIAIVVAGRTDAGVHALEQVFSFRASNFRPPQVVYQALNALLPGSVRALGVELEEPPFHARFSATYRRYQYLIKDGAAVEPFFRDRILYYPRPLDLERMQRGANYLLGTHDFATFSSQVPAGSSTVRHLEELSLRRQGVSGPPPFEGIGELIVMELKGSAFLRRMVRLICAALLRVGSGKWEAEEVAAILAKRNPRFAPPPAHPAGLYFKGVGYAQD